MSGVASSAASPAAAASPAGGSGAAPAGRGGAAPAPAHHPGSFKLRFAAQREPGRSYVSLVKPLGLPATVTNKFYLRAAPADGDAEGERRALRRIQDMFELGPRERHALPVTSAHECGWWQAAAARGDRRLAHHIRDSAWLKARLQVLAADASLKHK